MQTNIENFYRSVAQNPALLSKITTGANTPDEFIDRAVAVAKEEGYAIDRTEAKTWIDAQIASNQNGELSDTQLEAVAGGKGSIPGLPTSLGIPSGDRGIPPGGLGINPGGMYGGPASVPVWMRSW